MRKRLVSLLLLVAMLVSMFPVTAFASTSGVTLSGSATAIVGQRGQLQATATENGEAITSQPDMTWSISSGYSNQFFVLDAYTSAGKCIIEYVALRPGSYVVEVEYKGVTDTRTITVEDAIYLTEASPSTTIDLTQYGFSNVTAATSSNEDLATATLGGTLLTITKTDATQTGCITVAVTGDASASFTVYLNAVHVVWKYYPGSARLDTIPAGTVPTHVGTPQRESDENYSYTFAGWDSEPLALQVNNSYTANWIQTRLYSLTPSARSLELEAGTTRSVSVTHSPATLEGSDAIVWSSSNTSVATVTGSGTSAEIRALSAGTTNIICRVGTQSQVSIPVTVTEAESIISYSIALNKTTVNGIAGETVQLTTTVTPQTAQPGSMTWSSDNESVATVNSSGLVTLLSEGTANVTVTDGVESATCAVTVAAAPTTYTITWVVDGVTKTTVCEEGQTPVYPGATPTKSSSNTTHFAFAGWDPAPAAATGNATYTATWAETTRRYTITWKDGVSQNDTVQTYEYGATLVVPANPTKPADANYTYTFVGWTPTISNTVTTDVTYVAQYTATAKSRIELDTSSDALYIGETKQLNATVTPSTMVTTWSSSNASVATVSSSGLVTALSAGTTIITCKDSTNTYSASCVITVSAAPVTTYTITWVVNGVTTTETYAAEDTPSFKGSTDREGYTFTGWSPALTTVTQDQTYTAQYTQNVVQTYTITWVVDGTTTEEQYTAGATPSYKGATPAKDGYVFNGWSPDLSTVTKNQTYVALFTPTTQTYTITWVVDGNTTYETYSYGATPVFKGSITKEGYTFASWSPSIATVTKDQTYTAQFTKNTQYFNIIWVVDGVTTRESYAEGTIPVFKGSTDKPGYTFTGWSPTVEAATKDQTYTAQYTLTPTQTGSFTITWVVDGTTFTETYTAGAVPEFKGNTDKQGYLFTGWSPVIAAVTQNQTYTAQYTPVSETQYTITWVVDGKNYQTACSAGEMPVFTGSTIKAPTTQYEYTFIGWSSVVVPCTGNATYVALYNTTPRQYTITWIVNGNSITQPYTYGATPAYVGTPTKEDTAQYDYEFSAWSPALQFVTGDATYTAQFSVTVKKYTVTWKDYDGTVLKTEELEYGKTPNYGETLKRKSEKGIPYTFASWSPAITPIAGNVTYTATYTAGTGKEIFTVTFKNWDGTVLKTQEFKPGDKLVYEGETPVRETQNGVRYVFTGWDPDMADIQTVEENLTFTAQFKNESAHSFNIGSEELTAILKDTKFDGKTVDFIDGQLHLSAEAISALAKYKADITIKVTADTKKDIVGVAFYKVADDKETAITDYIPGLTFLATDLTTGDCVAIAAGDSKRYENAVHSIITDEGAYVVIPGSCSITTANSYRYYDDVNLNAWYYDDINFAASREIMIGTSYTEFSATTDVTRAQALMIVYRLSGEPTSATGRAKAYDDFDPNSWYAKAAYWSTSCDLLPARSEKTGYFGINDTITREDLALLLYNFVKSQGYACDETEYLGRYHDAGTMSSAAHAEAMEWAVANGIINGRTSTTLAPQGVTNRAEMASMLARVLAYMVIPAGMAN